MFFCKDTGRFPNSHLPVILYKEAISLPLLFRSLHIKKVFTRHQWTGARSGGVLTYPYYHSTTHKVLGFFEGSTTLQLGGDMGHKVRVAKGDVLIIPAGVAHRNLGTEFQVKCVSAYPNGGVCDLNTGKPGERPASDCNIAALPLPAQDPLLGYLDGLIQMWTLDPVTGRPLFISSVL